MMDFSTLLQGYTAHWSGMAAIAVVAAIAASAAWTLAVLVLRRIVRFSEFLTSLLDQTLRPARFAASLLALQFVWSAAPTDLALLLTISRLTGLLLIAAVTWMTLNAVRAVSETVIRLHPASVSDNLEARSVQTQTRVLARTVKILVVLIGTGAALMTFPAVRQLGATLLASAGVAGLVLGIAARPVIGSLIAGLQIALTQPIRLDDVVIMEGEWGRIEEITATYVVIKIWDERRLVVPLQWVIEHPFQNWTRREAQLLGTVTLWLDYSVSLAPLRAELERVCNESPEWDRRVALLQVVEAGERSIQVRALVSAADASQSWDLRCRVREALLDFTKATQPHALPRSRAELTKTPSTLAGSMAPAAMTDRGKGDSTAIRRPEHAGKHAPEPAPAP